MSINYNEALDLINDNLLEYLPEDDEYSHLLFDSQSYSLLAGGKRLRPMLVLGSCIMCGGSVKEALPFALAMEYIHTYSLIHDDLPAMDNDDYRRGKLTNHKMFGEDIAILGGDALLTAAMCAMSGSCSEDPSSSKALAMNDICIGAYNMVRGQVGDVTAGKDIEVEKLEYIHENKTAALIKASILAGAHIARASEEVIQDLLLLGSHFGNAFQLADDILDYETDDCLNYAQICGLNTARSRFDEHMKAAEDIINKFENNEILVKLYNNLFMSIYG